MNLDLRGKKALVCGSTRGIGKTAALELALLGATVTLLARNESDLKKSRSELSSVFHQKHDYLVADFSRPDELRASLERYMRQAGTVHILVNNTGGPPAEPSPKRRRKNSPRLFPTTWSVITSCPRPCCPA